MKVWNRIMVFTFVIAAFLVGLIVCAAIFQAYVVTTTDPEPEAAITRYTGGRIETIVHDGHKWAVINGYSGGDSMTHHPDCGCGKAAP